MIKVLKMFGRVQRGEKESSFILPLVFSPAWNPNTVGVEIPRLLCRAVGSAASADPVSAGTAARTLKRSSFSLQVVNFNPRCCHEEMSHFPSPLLSNINLCSPFFHSNLKSVLQKLSALQSVNFVFI